MGVLRINFIHLEFFNLHPMLGTQAFLHFTPIGMRPLWSGSNPQAQTQPHSTRTTAVGLKHVKDKRFVGGDKISVCRMIAFICKKCLWIFSFCVYSLLCFILQIDF